MSAPRHDVCVIGGGIVGLATALTLLRRRPGSDVVVLEKEDGLARHQTGHNSGVIHAGVYYAPGSLKARLCAQGARRTREFCDDHAIPYRDTGKLVVATDPAERARLDALFARATANGLDVELIDAAELARREPHVRGVAAIDVKSTGIVDYRAVCAAMADEIAALGGTVRTGVAVVGLHESAAGVDVDLTRSGGGVRRSAGLRRTPLSSARAEIDERVYADRLVACAGLQADRVAALAGLNSGVGRFQIVPFRGEYYRLPTSRSTANDPLVSTLIYPVPDPSLPFLGVHLTLTTDGGITVGPNAVLGFAREGYPHWSFDRRDVATYLRFPGFWSVARSQLRTGVVEQWNSLVKSGYLGRVRRYCPELTTADLLPEPAGIRAQAVLADGTLVEDFLIRRTARMVHVCNAPSPAATSALPIADHIVDELQDRG